jgi:hypothetical protein
MKARIRKFSLAYEVNKLKKILELPITNIVFDERYEYGKRYLDEGMNLITIYGRLYVNDDFIGTIPYMSDRWGPMYDTNKIKEEEFAWWDKVYRQFQQVIFNKIFQQQPLAVTAEIKEYGQLYVKDENGSVINLAFCNYVDDEWNVIVTGTNITQKVKVTRVILNPPRLIKGR